MNFQKIYIRTPKFFCLFMGSMSLFIGLDALYSWIFGASAFNQSLSNGKEMPLLWSLVFFGCLSCALIHEFFYYRKKMMAGYNDTGLCVYNHPTKSYIFILWNDLNHTSTSFGFGGYGFNPEGLITFDFKKAILCQVDKNSSYINNNGHCNLRILNEVELGEDSCSVDFGYWSWQPYTLKKEINKRSTL